MQQHIPFHLHQIPPHLGFIEASHLASWFHGDPRVSAEVPATGVEHRAQHVGHYTFCKAGVAHLLALRPSHM